MSQVDPVQRFFGGALMAVGGLIAALCGTCTLVVMGFGVFGLFDGSSSVGDLASGVAVLALVGGLPTVLGVLIFRWGWGLYRPTPRTSRDQVAVFSDDPEDRP